MFNKKKARLDPNSTDTLIGEGTVFEGRIKSEAGIRIEGQLTGDIECTGDVIVSEKGVLHSNITAREVIIAGTVTGNITTQSKLSISATGKLTGNISAYTFIIEEGGQFQGTSTMEPNKMEQSSSIQNPPIGMNKMA